MTKRAPRGGLLRVREFTMKDAYSFDTDWDALDVSYQAARAAYTRIFERCGIPAIPVLADSGAIGGKDSEEFIYLTDVGEDTILLCDNCGYAANEEKADHKKHEMEAEDPLPLEEVSTPGQKTIDDLVSFLGVPHYKTLKAVFYEADGEPVFVAIRGDLEVNEAKLRNALKAVELALLDDDGVRKHGLVAGSASPVGLKGIKIVADDTVLNSHNLVAGANKPDIHYKNVNHGRDWTADIVTDISRAQEGNVCARCGGTLQIEARRRDGARVQARHGVHGEAQRHVLRRERRPEAGGDGLLRHRRGARVRERDRGEPRRAGHHLAAGADAVRRAPGRAGVRQARACARAPSRSTSSSSMRALRCCTTTARRARPA